MIWSLISLTCFKTSWHMGWTGGWEGRDETVFDYFIGQDDMRWDDLSGNGKNETIQIKRY